MHTSSELTEDHCDGKKLTLLQYIIITCYLSDILGLVTSKDTVKNALDCDKLIAEDDDDFFYIGWLHPAPCSIAKFYNAKGLTSRLLR